MKESIDERVAIINNGTTLWLGIEGKTTNLRIWKDRLHAKCNPDNTEGIYVRLEKANEYSTPLSVEKLNYIENDKSPVHQLGKFDFPTNVENLNEIIELTLKLTIRKNIVSW